MIQSTLLFLIKTNTKYSKLIKVFILRKKIKNLREIINVSLLKKLSLFIGINASFQECELGFIFYSYFIYISKIDAISSCFLYI